jgi:hypothetical protein
MIPLCLALVVAFWMSPFQHVHVASGHEESAEHHHDHDAESAIVHIHFDGVAVPGTGGTSRLDDVDSDHVARSLDTFKAISHLPVLISVGLESRVLDFPPQHSSVNIVEAVESRAHDPPLLDRSLPRAPPV